MKQEITFELLDSNGYKVITEVNDRGDAQVAQMELEECLNRPVIILERPFLDDSCAYGDIL